MTFLEGLIRAYFHRNSTRVERLPNGGWRASVDYSEQEVERAMQRREAPPIRELMQPLVLRGRRPRRRLHWGRCRPSSGVLRLEYRGRFGQNPKPWGPEWELIANKLGAP